MPGPVERMVRFPAKHTAVALAVLVALSTGVAYYLVPRVGARYKLSIIVEVPEAPGAGKLFGWAEVVASAPGARPLAKTVEVKPGARTVTVTLDAARLVAESRRVVASAGPKLARVLRGEASAVSVILILYDERGGHYLASTVIGSYDVALEKYRSPVKAFRAVERNPYLVFQVGTIVVKAEAFSMVNVTSLYESIAREYYRLPNQAKHLEERGRVQVTPSGLRLPSGCTVVTIDNYRSYDLLLSSEDFIVLPELYNAEAPKAFKQHLHGLEDQRKDLVYKFFARRFSTAVYVPASCPLDWAVYNALSWWYDPVYESPALVGILPLQALWYKMAVAVVGEGVAWQVRWEDTTKGVIERVKQAPILRLAGVCWSECSNNIDFQIIVGVGESSYYKNGISIANIILLGKETSIENIDVEAVSLSPADFKAGLTGFITADATISSDGDGVFIDYYVRKVTLYDRLGRPHQYWMIMPVTVFIPLQKVKVDWSSLTAVRVGYRDSSYRVYMNKYFKLLGATRANYTWMSRYITGIQDVVLDTTNYVKQRTSYAGAVVGIAENLLGMVVSAVASGGLASTLTGIAGSLVSYAYDVYGESLIVIKLKAVTHSGFDGGYIEVYKMTPYLGYNPQDLYFTSRRYAGHPPYPVFITYFIIYKG